MMMQSELAATGGPRATATATANPNPNPVDGDEVFEHDNGDDNAELRGGVMKSSVFSVGQRVWYKSSSSGEELKGRVTANNKGNGAIDLNIREEADPSRVRARGDDEASAADEYDHLDDDYEEEESESDEDEEEDDGVEAMDADDPLFAVDQRVWYQSSSGEELKARVVTFFGTTVDLNIRDEADASRIRPRGDDEASEPDEYDHLDDDDDDDDDDDEEEEEEEEDAC